MSRLYDFSGGLNNRLDPLKIAINQAVKLVNADIDSGSLVSFKDFSVTDTAVDSYAYKYEDTWISSTSPTSYVEYNSNLYYTREGSVAKKVVGENTYDLGIQSPANDNISNGEGDVEMDISDDIIDEFSGEPFKNFQFDATSITNLEDYGYLQFIAANGSIIGSSGSDEVAAYGESWDTTLTSLDLLISVLDLNGNSIAQLENTIELDDPLGITTISIFGASIVIDRIPEIRVHTNLSVDHSIKIYIKTGVGDDAVYHLAIESAIEVTALPSETNGYNIFSIKYKDFTENEELPAISDASADGTIQYLMTYYNKDLGIESIPSEQTREISSSGTLFYNLSNFNQPTDPQVTHIRVYRIGPISASYIRVAEIEVSEEDTTVMDFISSLEVDGVLDSVDNYPPDADMHSLVESNGTFFGLVGDEVRFSTVGEPDYFPPANSFKLRENGTALQPTFTGVLIFTSHLTYLLSGTDITNFQLTLVTPRQGCISNQSTQIVKSQPIWISDEGVATWQSGYTVVISKSMLGNISLDVKQTAVVDEQYYILTNDGDILVLDLRYSPRFYRLSFSKAVDGMHVSDGVLYFSIAGLLATAFTGDSLPLEYKSPDLALNYPDRYKAAKKLYIAIKGAFSVTLNIDGVDTVYAIKSDAVEINMPIDRYYVANISLKGTGKVHAIDFVENDVGLAARSDG